MDVHILIRQQHATSEALTGNAGDLAWDLLHAEQVFCLVAYNDLVLKPVLRHSFRDLPAFYSRMTMLNGHSEP